MRWYRFYLSIWGIGVTVTYVSVPCVCLVFMEARRKYLILLNWNCRQWLVATRVLGTEPGSSRKQPVLLTAELNFCPDRYFYQVFCGDLRVCVCICVVLFLLTVGIDKDSLLRLHTSTSSAISDTGKMLHRGLLGQIRLWE